MRSFLTTMCAVLLILLVVAPVASESIDADVQAARAAERAESVRIEQSMGAPSEPLNVSVTEVQNSENPEQATSTASEQDDSAATSAGDSGSTAGRNRSSAKSDTSARSDASDRSDDYEVSTRNESVQASVAPVHRNRPDKVALMMDSEKSKQSEKKQSGTMGTILLTIVKLAAVLVLAYLTILALKWFSARHEVMPSNHKQFRMVDTLRFNNTSSLHLVEVKGAILLLGCTSGQVSVLKEFDEAELSDSEGEPAGKFAEYLAKYSDMSAKHGPSGRIAGMLRDCSSYLRDRYQTNRVGVRDEK